MHKILKSFVIGLLMFPSVAVFAQSACNSDQLVIKVQGRYFSENDFNIHIDENPTVADILGDRGPYAVDVIGDGAKSPDEIVNYTLTGSRLLLTGLDTGSVTMEVTDSQGFSLRLRMHVNSLAEFVLPRQEFSIGGASLDGGKTFEERVDFGDQLALMSHLCPYADQIGNVVDILAVLRTQTQDGASTWYYVTGKNRFALWDTRLATLKPYLENFPLAENYTLTLFEGAANRTGRISFYIGFQNESGLVFNEIPETIIVEE
ncbi:MAG: hypothetical protein RQ899_15070 [Pseudomonadales bacterium]|nr:hypothetical protein [Pseudomonadales bacterium]